MSMARGTGPYRDALAAMHRDLACLAAVLVGGVALWAVRG